MLVPMNPLETYLTELREIHDSGAATKETSGYPALAKLLGLSPERGRNKQVDGS